MRRNSLARALTRAAGTLAGIHSEACAKNGRWIPPAGTQAFASWAKAAYVAGHTGGDVKPCSHCKPNAA